MSSRPSHHLLAGSLLVSALSFTNVAIAAPSLQVDEPVLGEAEDRQLLSVPPPLCDGLPCTNPGGETAEPQAVGLRRVYLNFEGVTLTASTQSDDATTNTSFIVAGVTSPGNTVTVPPFDRFDLGSQSGATSRQQIIDYTLDKVREYHAPYNFEFTTTRPTSGNYHMVVFGGTCNSVVGQDCAGIAPLDCNDFSPSNVVFAFPSGLRAVDLATTATQELAHAIGLSHTLDTSDFMYPFIQNDLPTRYGEGAIPNKDQGNCGNGSYQNSHEKLLGIVGFPGQDGTPPAVLITSPSNGDVVSFGQSVESTIDDASPIAKVELKLNNAVVETRTSPPFTFQIPDSSPTGQVSIEVRATDDQGNEAGNRVTVYIGTGNEEPCDNGQCADGFECIDMLCFPSTPGSGAALGALCEENESCTSEVCAEFDSEKRCSQACDEETVCPEGFECLGGTACWPKDGKSDGGLCSIAKPGPGALSSLAFLFFAVVFGRRRRRS